MPNLPSRRVLRVPTFAPYYGSADYLICLQNRSLILYYSYDIKQITEKESTTYLIAYTKNSLRPVKTVKISGQYRILNAIEEKGLVVLRDTKDKTSLLLLKCYGGFKSTRVSLGNGFCRDLSQIFYNNQLAKMIFWHAGETTYLFDPSRPIQEPDPIFKCRDGISRVFMDPIRNCLLGFSKATLKIYSFAFKKVVKKMKSPLVPENILYYKAEDNAVLILEKEDGMLFFQVFILNAQGLEPKGKRVAITLLEPGYYLTFHGFNGNTNEVVIKLQYRTLISLRDTKSEYELLLIDIWNPQNFQRVRSHELKAPEGTVMMSYNQSIGSLICKTTAVSLQLISLDQAVKRSHFE